MVEEVPTAAIRTGAVVGGVATVVVGADLAATTDGTSRDGAARSRAAGLAPLEQASSATPANPNHTPDPRRTRWDTNAHPR